MGMLFGSGSACFALDAELLLRMIERRAARQLKSSPKNEWEPLRTARRPPRFAQSPALPPFRLPVILLESVRTTCAPGVVVASEGASAHVFVCKNELPPHGSGAARP